MQKSQQCGQNYRSLNNFRKQNVYQGRVWTDEKSWKTKMKCTFEYGRTNKGMKLWTSNRSYARKRTWNSAINIEGQQKMVSYYR